MSKHVLIYFIIISLWIFTFSFNLLTEEKAKLEYDLRSRNESAKQMNEYRNEIEKLNSLLQEK